MATQNAIILHGLQRRVYYFDPDYPTASNTIWLPWLQKQLILLGIDTQTPEMPRSWRPDYRLWSEVLERQLITPSTIVVAHSCGAGFLLQWLVQHPEVRVGHVFLIAPWLGYASEHEDDPEDGQFTGGLFDFTISADVLGQTASLTLYHSLTDRAYIAKSVEKIRNLLPGIEYREFSDMGHFTTSGMGRDSFDELLGDILDLYKASS